MIDYKVYFNKLNKIGRICLGIIILAVLLPPVFSFKPHQDVYLPEYSAFSTRNTNPDITLQTFDDPKVVSLNWYHDSGRSYSMYLTIKKGNKLYDSGGSYCGSLIVKRNGSIVIKGWGEANGHYYGVDGEKASVKKAQSKKQKKHKLSNSKSMDETSYQEEFYSSADEEDDYGADPVEPEETIGSSHLEDDESTQVLSEDRPEQQEMTVESDLITISCPNWVHVGESFNVSFVFNEEPADFEFSIPDGIGLSFGPQKSKSTSIVDGKQVTKTSYVYVLLGEKLGDYSIYADAVLQNQKVQSPHIFMEVIDKE